MLPGFRFLFAAILLSTSILVFGLGAAALLRASHQQYVDNPSWRNGPQEQVFAQAPEPAQPVLAALRVEPAATEATPTIRDRIPSIGLPAVETGLEPMAPVTLEAKVQPELQVSAIAPAAEVVAPVAEAPALEPAKSDAQAPTDTLTRADTTVSTAPARATSATEVPRTATPALASRVADIAVARIAALNELAPAKTKADSAAPESKPRAQKPKKRRRIVRRPPPPAQQLDPFGQPQPALAATTTARAR
ncbi:hypothetical protein ACQ86E_07045 [Bradyrhizobium betae]|uniref:hypothetical protein n=1 Tax=Bradyrhizobium betae TaxID=244734 RepID=UPI003D669F7A